MIARWLPAAFAAFFAFSAGPGARAQAPAAGAPAPAAGAQAPNTAISGEITLVSYAGVFQDNYTATVIEPFLRRFPNVRINYFPGGTSAQMLGTVRGQRSDPLTDVPSPIQEDARRGPDHVEKDGNLASTLHSQLFACPSFCPDRRGCIAAGVQGEVHRPGRRGRREKLSRLVDDDAFERPPAHGAGDATVRSNEHLGSGIPRGGPECGGHGAEHECLASSRPAGRLTEELCVRRRVHRTITARRAPACTPGLLRSMCPAQAQPTAKSPEHRSAPPGLRGVPHDARARTPPGNRARRRPASRSSSHTSRPDDGKTSGLFVIPLASAVPRSNQRASRR